MSQGLNSFVPLNTATQQYLWNPDNSLESLSAPSLPSRNLYSDNLMGLDQPNLYFTAAENNQNIVPLYGRQMMGGG